jgi:hypothetical protein
MQINVFFKTMQTSLRKNDSFFDELTLRYLAPIERAVGPIKCSMDRRKRKCSCRFFE